MNANGISIPRIYKKFIDKDTDIDEIIEEYYYSEYIDIIIDIQKKTKLFETTNAILFTYDDLYNNKINLFISQNGYIFARLDSLSSKPTSPYKSSYEITEEWAMSTRIKDYFIPKCNIWCSKWISIFDEFRCFVHNKKLRGITHAPPYISLYLSNITTIIKEITASTYNDFTIDFGFTKEKNLLFIEINTPVYLCATSGLFDLENPYDYEILLGKYNPDINYPEIRYSSCA